jgi:hypothetical protein
VAVLWCWCGAAAAADTRPPAQPWPWRGMLLCVWCGWCPPSALHEERLRSSQQRGSRPARTATTSPLKCTRVAAAPHEAQPSSTHR